MNVRRSERVSLDFDAEAVIFFQNKEIKGLIENVSTRGIFIKSKDIIPADENVKVCLLPVGKSNKTIKLNGLIVWSDNSGMGIQFDESEASNYLIDDLDIVYEEDFLDDDIIIDY